VRLNLTRSGSMSASVAAWPLLDRHCYDQDTPQNFDRPDRIRPIEWPRSHPESQTRVNSLRVLSGIGSWGGWDAEIGELPGAPRSRR
jgi:hypothetical protein